MTAVAATFATSVAGATAVMGPADAATSARSEYQAALKASAAQDVHYVSKAADQGVVLEVIGDTGKTSGSQVLEVQNGATVEELEVILIGSTGYIKGNDSALLRIVGLTSAQSGKYSGKWLSFPSADSSLSDLVSGLRNSNVPSELQMTGPYTLGGTKKVNGQETRAIKGSAATSSGSKVPIVLYVDASGTPRPVEEITNPHGKNSSIEGSVTFSKWGEKNHPKAPNGALSLISLIPAG
jgi:hypothetical protein